MSKHQLRELLTNVSRDTIWGEAIHHCLENNGDLGELVLELQSQHRDNALLMECILGKKLSAYISKPLYKKQL